MFQSVKLLGKYLDLRVLHGQLQNEDDRVKSDESQVTILDNFLRARQYSLLMIEVHRIFSIL